MGIEVYSQQKTIVIDNFRKAEFFGFSRGSMKSVQDKGHANQFKKWLASVRDGGSAIIPADELFNTSRAVILAVESMKEGRWMNVGG